MLHQKIGMVFKMLMVLSDVISLVHEEASNSVIQLLREEVGYQMTDQAFKQALDRLSEYGDVELSLVLNLGILLKYATLTNQQISSQIFFDYFKRVASRIKASSSPSF